MLGIFSNKAKKRKKELAKSHINALWEILIADGRTHMNEIKMLDEIALAHKLTQKEVGQIRASGLEVSANKDDIEFIVPESDEERMHFIYDLVCMMMIDGDIDYREKETCKDYAVKLGFEKDIVDQLVVSISKNVSSGNDLSEIYNRLYPVIRKEL